MNRRIASILLAGFTVSAATGAAFALGNAVSTTPSPAFVRSIEPASHSTDDPATHDAGDGHGRGSGRSGPSSSATVGIEKATDAGGDQGPASPGPVVDGHGADDPVNHDVTDDHGDHRGTVGTTTTSSPATATVDDHGADDPATHDIGDDQGVDNPATAGVTDDHSGAVPSGGQDGISSGSGATSGSSGSGSSGTSGSGGSGSGSGSTGSSSGSGSGSSGSGGHGGLDG